MSLPTNEELDIQRRQARRNMAWISFWILVIYSSIILFILLTGSEEIATVLNTASFAVIGIYTVFTSIILGYLGVSVAENIFKK